MAGGGGGTSYSESPIALQWGGGLLSLGYAIDPSDADGLSIDWEGNYITGGDAGVQLYRDGGASWEDNPNALAWLVNDGLDLNPYTGVSATDSSSHITNIANASTALSSAISSLSDLSTIYSTGIPSVTVDYTDATSSDATASAAGISLSSTASTATAPITDTTTISELSDVYGASFVSNMEGHADTLYDGVKSKFDTLVSDIGTEADSIETAIRTAIDSFTTDADNIVDTIMTNFETAIASLIDTDVISDRVTAYENNAKKVYLSSLNRFSGGMASVGAANSSAYIIGMSLMEADFDNKVNEFQAQLELQLYSQGMQVYFSTAAEALRAGATAYIEGYKSSAAVYQGLSTYFGYYVEVFKTSVNAALSTVVEQGKLDSMVSLQDAESSLRTALQNAELNTRATLTDAELETRGGISDAQLATQVALQNAELGTRVGMQNALENTRASIAEIGLKSDLTKLGINIEQFELQTRQALASISIDSERMKYVMNVEEDNRNLEIDAKDALWDVGAMQEAGNVFSVLQGAVVASEPKNPSKMSSILSGSFSGASLGVGATAALAAAGPVSWVTAAGLIGGGAIAGAIAGNQ